MRSGVAEHVERAGKGNELQSAGAAGRAGRALGGRQSIQSFTSVVEDSRKAGPGSCFVAVRGTKADGHQFVDHGGRGRGGGDRLRAAGRCAARTWPSCRCRRPAARRGGWRAVLTGLDAALREERLKIVGITGTNGKSTFCYLVQSILRDGGRADRPAGHRAVRPAGPQDRSVDDHAAGGRPGRLSGRGGAGRRDPRGDGGLESRPGPGPLRRPAVRGRACSAT